MKKRLTKKFCPMLVLFLTITCFFMFGRNISADDETTPAKIVPTITSYGMKGQNLVISWSLPKGYTYRDINIYCATSPDGEYSCVDILSSPASSYTNEYTAKGVPYYYMIEAEYWDEESNDWKLTEPAYTGKCITELPAPSFSATAGNSHSITLKWKASLDCDGYQIYQSKSPNGPYSLLKTIKTYNDDDIWWDDDYDLNKSYTIKNLTLGKTYYYKIQPYITFWGNNFDGNLSGYRSAQVTINGTKVKSASSNKVKTNTITWAKNNEADGYIIYYSKTKNGKYTKLKTYTSRNKLSYTHNKLTNGTAYYYKIQSYKNYNGEKLTGPMSIYKKYCDYYTYKDESYESKCKRIFGKEYYKKYKNSKEAKKHMTTITIKVWDQKGKKKFTRKFHLTVNKKLAPSIKQMFYEIYKSKERFPIHDIGCYSWRGNNSKSEHCLGLSFDINANENYMIDNGHILAGSFWKPNKNRYSIPLNCQLVKILQKYGFERGLWGSRKDYMHFSYFGT